MFAPFFKFEWTFIFRCPNPIWQCNLNFRCRGANSLFVFMSNGQSWAALMFHMSRVLVEIKRCFDGRDRCFVALRESHEKFQLNISYHETVLKHKIYWDQTCFFLFLSCDVAYVNERIKSSSAYPFLDDQFFPPDFFSFREFATWGIFKRVCFGQGVRKKRECSVGTR